MKNYPRALNRVFTFIVALLLLAAGAGLITAAFLPGVAQQWDHIGSNVEQWWTSVSEQSTVIGQEFSWMTIALIVLGVLAIIVLLAIVLQQGGGRVSNLDDPQADELGQTRVTPAFIEDLVREKVSQNPWVHSVSAKSYQVRKDSVLALTLLTHKGASPANIAELAEQIVADLDAVLGGKVPVYVHQTTNWQTAMSKRKRVR